jgi:hypothetical protein
VLLLLLLVLWQRRLLLLVVVVTLSLLVQLQTLRRPPSSSPPLLPLPLPSLLLRLSGRRVGYRDPAASATAAPAMGAGVLLRFLRRGFSRADSLLEQLEVGTTANEGAAAAAAAAATENVADAAAAAAAAATTEGSV